MTCETRSIIFDESRVPLIKNDSPSTSSTPSSWLEAILQPWHVAKSYLYSLKKYLFSPCIEQRTHADLEASIDEECFIENDVEEQGTINYRSGNIYEGQLKDNIPNGQGILKFKNGDVYKGQFVGGRIEGHGTFVFKNKNIYEGQFVNYQFEGQGTLQYANGKSYKGEFHLGIRHGYGIYKSKNGNTYEGHFYKNKKEGLGIKKYANGDIFIGEYKANKQEGPGFMWSENSDSNQLGFTAFKANYINGSIQGEITLYSLEGAHKIIVKNNQIINLNRFQIGDLLFFCLLYGIDHKTDKRTRFGYANGILADYLQNYFQDNPDALKVTDSLAEANYLAALPLEERTVKVFLKLCKKEPCLMRYGCKGHAMLLNFVPSKNGEFVDIEIFNSGLGLKKYHIREESKKRYQTKKIIRIPKSELTLKKLRKIVNFKKFQTIDKAYRLFLDIPGAECIKQENPIYRKPQAARNCSLKCDLDYVEDKLPLFYKKMIKNLFQASLEARIKQEKNLKQKSCKNHPRVQHKVRSLKLVHTPYGKNKNH